jgi:hypothetical protein
LKLDEFLNLLLDGDGEYQSVKEISEKLGYSATKVRAIIDFFRTYEFCIYIPSQDDDKVKLSEMALYHLKKIEETK